jgi:hypothetical protein
MSTTPIALGIFVSGGAVFSTALIFARHRSGLLPLTAAAVSLTAWVLCALGVVPGNVAVVLTQTLIGAFVLQVIVLIARLGAPPRNIWL